MNDQKETQLENEYATKDLYFAAYLYVKNIELKKLEKYGNGKSPVYFIFNNKEKCNKLEEVFWNGTGEEVMVNIKDYTEALRNLRTRAFSVAMVVRRAENSWKEDEER